jgi:hypothetical protein
MELLILMILEVYLIFLIGFLLIELNIYFILGLYNAKNNPDVKSGKKTEDEILGEFLDTFEIHHSNMVYFKYN